MKSCIGATSFAIEQLIQFALTLTTAAILTLRQVSCFCRVLSAHHITAGEWNPELGFHLQRANPSRRLTIMRSANESRASGSRNLRCIDAEMFPRSTRCALVSHLSRWFQIRARLALVKNLASGEHRFDSKYRAQTNHTIQESNPTVEKAKSDKAAR